MVGRVYHNYKKETSGNKTNTIGDLNETVLHTFSVSIPRDMDQVDAM